MIYRILVLALVVFTLLDALNTAVGLHIGLIELNPVVKELGLPLWALFRIMLLACMATVFLAGYRFCMKHFQKGIWILGTTLLTLDSYIGTVVFTGYLAMSLRLLS